MAVCPSCGEENSRWFRSCAFCGAALHEPLPPQAEERKIVSVLFCDLVGFTARSDKSDPEDIRARIRPYHTRLRREIEAYGGTVEKFIGDAVMAVFGAPVAHEDDSERAVRAGLRILEAIADLNQTDPSLELRVRVGIETGEAIVVLGARPELGEGLVIGDVVNTSSRLQGAAPVNGVAVGAGTYQATRDIFEYEALAAVPLKGKAEPVPVFLARVARARFGTDLAPKPTTPLVGRELERNLLTGMFKRSVQEHSVQLVTIVGEAGVGKSRLVAELRALIDAWPRLVRWRQGRCLPYGDAVTFWALGEMLKTEAGILETDAPMVATSKIDAAIPDTHPDAPWLRQRLRPLVGVEAPKAAREENFAAWRAFLELLAGNGTCVFVFEDLHWADDALLAFLEHLALRAEGVPILLIGTARPELFERAPSFARGARNSHRIELPPLGEQDMAQLVSNLLERAVLPAEVTKAILSRSEGNPLYAEEFVRLLKDRKILTKQGAMWTMDRTAEIPLPSGVHGLIAARLDTLSGEHKRVLQDASVIGKVFWAEAVAEMREQGLEVGGVLDELTRKELVRPALASSMEGQAEYVFSHALVRDVCYAQIPRASRAERHRQAAAWIEGVAGERLEDHAEILAAHYTTAFELALASKGPAAEELRANAVRYLTLAGDRAIGMDVVAAERHYAQALGMASEIDPGRAALLARHGEALLQRGRFPEAARAYEEAIQRFRAQGDVRAMAGAMNGWGLTLRSMGDARHRSVSGEALSMLEPAGPSPDLVQALTEEAGSRYVAGENHRAIALADSAISLAAELGLPEPVRALGFRGAALAFLGDTDGVDDMRRALRAAAVQGLGREAALLRLSLASVLLAMEGPRASLAMLKEGAALAQRRGIEEFVLAFSTSRLEVLVDVGAYDEAIALVGDLAPRLEEAEHVLMLAFARSCQVSVLARRGEYVEAAPFGEWVTAHAREMAEPDLVALALPPAATVRLGLGDPAEAAARLSELEATPNIRDTFFYVRALADTVRTALAAGAPELALRLTGGVRLNYSLHEHALTTARALLAEHRGDQAGAEKLYSEAAERWRTFEMPWERAQALLGQGRCLLAIGRFVEATPCLRHARELFASLRAKPALAETDALLGRATALTS